MLALMRKRHVNERELKKNRARDRIEAENIARLEKALSAMNIARHSTANRLERAPEHFRPLLAVFLRPGVIKTFLAYAKKAGRLEITKLVDETSGATSPHPKTSVPATASPGLPPPRRAISLDYRGLHTNHAAATAAAVAASTAAFTLADDPETRRRAAFGDLPPRGGRKQRSGSIGVGSKSTGKRKLGGGVMDNAGRDISETRWRAHGEDPGFDLTFTAATAAGRLPDAQPPGDIPATTANMDAGGVVEGLGTAAMVAAAGGGDAIAARVRELEQKEQDLGKREVCGIVIRCH